MSFPELVPVTVSVGVLQCLLLHELVRSIPCCLEGLERRVEANESIDCILVAVMASQVAGSSTA